MTNLSASFAGERCRMNGLSVPLRTPPPKPETIMDQWLIDALHHLDECIDDGKQQNKEAFNRLNDAQQELRAEVTASITALFSGDDTLKHRFDAHEQEHRQAARKIETERGVWASQYRWAREVVRTSFEVGKIAAGVGALRLLGVL